MFVFCDMVQPCSVICAQNARINVITVNRIQRREKKIREREKEKGLRRERGEKRT